MKAVGIVVVIIIAILISLCVMESRQEDIKKWAKANGYTIISSESPAFEYGPYNYCGRGQSIYRVEVETADKTTKIFWFRFGVFSPDIEEYNR